MKFFFGALAACLIFIQSMHAIPSNLGESILEYQAILNSDLLQTTVPQAEFIFEIERKTKSIDATLVHYEIKTRIFYKEHHKTHEYIATLSLTPNPQIGPPIITVVSITPKD